MRERMLGTFFILLALMASAGNCEELPGTTLVKHTGSNTTILSAGLSFNDSHSISKRNTKDSVIYALTFAANGLAISSTLSFEVPVVAVAFGLLASVAQMGILFVTVVTNTDSVFYKDYQNLKDCFTAYIDKNGGPNVKKNLLAAASDAKIRTIINGIQAYMLEQKYYNQSLIDSGFNGEVFATWTGEARAYLYETIIIKAFVIGIQAKSNNKNVTLASITKDMQSHVNKATNILEQMGKIGREMYWERDVKDHIEKEMTGWHENGFQGIFGKAMEKYQQYKELHIAVAVTSFDPLPRNERNCYLNHKHDTRNLIPNATIVINMKEIERTGLVDGMCLTLYIFRIPLNLINNGARRTVPEYVKHIGEKYGDAVTERPDLDFENDPYALRSADWRFKPHDQQMFDDVLIKAVNVRPAGYKPCLFDLAKFQFVPNSGIVSVWPRSVEQYGLIIKQLLIPYRYHQKEYWVDTVSIC